MPAGKAQKGDLLSIGTLSKLSGQSLDTLRVWERRYGRPKPIRLPSGHRRYSQADVLWLSRVSEALAAGKRPSEVVGKSDAELTVLLEQTKAPQNAYVDELLELVRSARTFDLARVLRERLEELGIEAWQSLVVAPALIEIGRGWAAEELDVYHESLATEVFLSELRRLRSRLQPMPGPLRVLVTTLPDERHTLGMELVALTCARKGIESCCLGPGLSVKQVLAAVQRTAAGVLAISVSSAVVASSGSRALAGLRESLEESVELVVGGQGSTRLVIPDRVIRMLELADFETWLAELPEGRERHSS